MKFILFPIRPIFKCILNKKIIVKIFILINLILLFIIRYNDITKEWIKYDSNPVLGNKETGTVFDPFVIKLNYMYKMFVSWRPKGAIALTSSKDGINWSPLEIVLNKGNNKSWENNINRASVLLLNKKFYMYYTGQYNGISKIGLAFSDDGYNFVKYNNNPVLEPEFDFEKQSVMNPHVIYDKEENLFKMWYSAGETYEPDVICYATSKDGITWKKYEKNPIFTPNQKKMSLDWFKIGGCDVHKISNQKYLMFYIGYSDINTARIFVAKSKNGINNWERSENPIIKPSKGKFDSDACYKPSAIYDKVNKKWIIWYNGRKKNFESIGTATYNKYKFTFCLSDIKFYSVKIIL